MAVELATAYVSILPETSKISSGVRRALGGVDTRDVGDKAGQSFGQRFASRAGMVVKRAAQVGVIAAAAGFVALGTAAFKSATNIEKSQRTLTGLYGSAEDAADIMQRLRKVAADSPIDYAAYTKGAEQLAYMGYKGKDAEQILSNVGAAITAAGGDSASMGRATDAMLQMVNSGKVYASQLNQISATGIPIFSGLASHFNTNIANVREMVTAGEVGIEDVMSVIQNAEGDTFKQMQRAAKETSKSFSDQFKIAKDNVVTSLGTMLVPVIAALAPQIGRLGDLVAGGIAALPDIFDRVRSVLTSGPVADVLSSIGDALGRVWGAAKRLIAPIGEVVSALAPIAAVWVGIVVAGPIVLAFQALAIAGELVAAVLERVGQFARENTTVVQILAGVVLTAVTAVAIYRTVMGAAAAATAIWTAVTKGAAGAQRVLNAVMRANPIGLVITAITLLVGGFILAYNKSETFRNIVQGALNAVADAGKWMWESILKPAFEGMQVAFQAVAAACKWMWESVIKPAFNGIQIAGKILFAVLVTAVITPIMLYFRALGAIAHWLWNNAIKPAFTQIGAIAQWLWRNVIRRVVNYIIAHFRAMGSAASWLWNKAIQPALRAIGRLFQWLWRNVIQPVIRVINQALRGLGAVATWLWNNAVRPAINSIANIFRWLWRNIVQPVFRGIANTIRTIWNSLIRPAFRAIQSGVESVGAVFTWLRDNVIGPVWDWISRKIRGVWDKGIRPAFATIKDAVADVGTAFEKAQEFIGKAWDKVANIVRKPINWVIINVINDGIIDNFNKIAKTVGLGDDFIDRISYRVPQFASGGRLKGPGTPTSDSILMRGSVDEYMIRERAAKKVDYPFLDWINRGNNPFHFPGELPGFSGGGRVYPVGSHNFGRGSAAHGYPAVDWPRAGGYRVNAAQAGRVSQTMHASTSYGNRVRVNHDGGFQTLYAHLSRILASVGQDVVAGTRIGSVGTTGNSTGNHLHFEVLSNGRRIDPMAWLRGAGQGDSSGGGGDGGIIGWIKNAFKGFKSVAGWARDKAQAMFDFVDNGAGVIRHFIGNKLGDWVSGGPFDGLVGRIIRGVPRFLTSTIVDAAKGLGSKIADLVPTGPADAGAGASGTAKGYALSMLGNYGWTTSQWPALEELWRRESNWNHRAVNPSSGATGIPQSLPASKMASAGSDYLTNPHTQIRWGMGYIKGRFGSPKSALAFHDRNNWYDRGGVLPPGSTNAVNTTKRPEAVLTNDQWKNIQTIAERPAGGDTYQFTMRHIDLNERTFNHVLHATQLRKRIGRPR